MKKMDVRAVGRRMAAFALAGVMATSPLYPVTLAFAAPSASEIEQQLKVAEQELDALERQLNQTEAELGRTNFELDQTKGTIAELEENIGVNEEKLTVAKSRLSAVIGESYRQGGDMSLLDLVLNSESFDDFISRVYYANKVVEKKNKEINTVASLRAQLLADKALLEEQQREQERLMAEQESQIALMQESASEQASYIENLSEEVVEAMESERRAAAQASLQAAREVLGDDFVNGIVFDDPSFIETYVEPKSTTSKTSRDSKTQTASDEREQESAKQEEREDRQQDSTTEEYQENQKPAQEETY
ncbi:MAG: hypothetical protein U0J70_09170, partial [Atopobiaceae bacterium]|nr:hypothetical protein [Atopobiaceae bacterium]